MIELTWKTWYRKKLSNPYLQISHHLLPKSIIREDLLRMCAKKILLHSHESSSHNRIWSYEGCYLLIKKKYCCRKHLRSPTNNSTTRIWIQVDQNTFWNYKSWQTDNNNKMNQFITPRSWKMSINKITTKLK